MDEEERLDHAIPPRTALKRHGRTAVKTESESADKVLPERFRTLAVVGSVAGVAVGCAIRWHPGLLGLNTLNSNLAPLLDFTALFFVTITFLYALREAWYGRLPLRIVVGLTVAYHVVILLQPLIYGRGMPGGGDVYSYAMYGQMMSIHHANPYLATPSMFPFDPIFQSVPWQHSPSVYGPLFTLMSAGLTRGLRGITSIVLAYRIVAVTASLAIVLLVAALAKRIRPDRAAFAAALVGLNPVVLFGTTAEAHNDLLVGLAIIGGLWLLFQRRELAATAVLTLGMLIKTPAAIPLLLLITTIVARRQPGDRLRTLGAHAAVVGGLSLAAAAPFLQSKDPTLGLTTLATRQTSPAPSLFVVRRVEWFVCRLGGCGLSHLAGVGVRMSFLLFFLVGLVYVARNLLRNPEALSPSVQGAAWAWGLLLLTLCAPMLAPWYLVWVLPLAWLLPRIPMMFVIATGIAASLAIAIVDPAGFPGVLPLIVWLERIGNFTVVVIFFWFGLHLARRWRSGIALDVDGMGSRVA